MWTYYCGFLISILLSINYVQSTAHSRQRRYLLFTKDTQWGVFATVSVPLHPESTVSVAWFFEANYYNVDNATYFDPLLGDIDTISRTREDRSITNSRPLLTRSRLYSLIETMLEQHGFPGSPCLLRAICENVHSNFLHNGLLGDWLHLIFTPSTSISEEDVDDCYYKAEYYGMNDQCTSYQRDCPENPLDSISVDAENYL